MALEDVKVANPVLDELRADELPTTVPKPAIGCEDTVAQKLLPFFVEGFAFAIVTELGRKNRLDVLRIDSQNGSPAGHADFGSLQALGLGKDRSPELEVLVVL